MGSLESEHSNVPFALNQWNLFCWSWCWWIFWQPRRRIDDEVVSNRSISGMGVITTKARNILRIVKNKKTNKQNFYLFVSLSAIFPVSRPPWFKKTRTMVIRRALDFSNKSCHTKSLHLIAIVVRRANFLKIECMQRFFHGKIYLRHYFITFLL